MLLLTLFLEFLKIGLFTFGGGYAMIPLIKEAVLKHGWLSEEQFLNMIGVSLLRTGYRHELHRVGVGRLLL